MTVLFRSTLSRLPAARTACSGVASRTRTLYSTSLPKMMDPSQVTEVPKPGPYQSTIRNLNVPKGAPVIALGTNGLSLKANKAVMDKGVNIIGAVNTGSDGAPSTFLDTPVYPSLKEAVKLHKPYAAAVFEPSYLATDVILDCIKEEIPLVVVSSEGVQPDSLIKINDELKNQDKTRVVGPNSCGVVLGCEGFMLGIEPADYYRQGYVGIVARSHTVGCELTRLTSGTRQGQSAVINLGPGPWPFTRMYEALQWLVHDEETKIIVLAGEIEGKMEEEAAMWYKEYKDNLPSGHTPKPVVGYIAKETSEWTKFFGQTGEVNHDEVKRREEKAWLWEKAGFRVARSWVEIPALIMLDKL